MSEERIAPEKEKTKKRRAVPVSVFVGIALFILISATVCLYAVEQRKKMISNLDKRLGQRKDKITSLDQWYMDAVKAYESKNAQDDESESVVASFVRVNRMDNGYVIADGRTVLITPDLRDTYTISISAPFLQDDLDTDEEYTETYKKDSYSAFAIPDKDFSYNYESAPYSTLIVDPDEDSVFVKDDIPYICYGGYIYRETFLYDSDGDKVLMGMEGINAQSVENRELRAAAFSYVQMDNTENQKEPPVRFGFEGNYRYCMFYSLTGYSIPQLKDNELNALHVDDRTGYTEIDLGYNPGDFLYIYSYTVIFQDAGPEFSSWRNQVVTAGVIGLVIFTILLAGTILLEKKNREVSDSEEENTGSTGNASAWKISKDITDLLMEKIDAAESSMGPNGYLEEIRETIEKMKK